MEKFSPLFFCLCGPVACGKSTISRRLVENDASLTFSVSSTTRAPRPGEAEGVAYYFIDDQKFLARKAEGQFIEDVTVGGKRYGTEKCNVARAERSQQDLILDIEWQGAANFRAEYGDRVKIIFVFPPSWTVLKERVGKRPGMTPEQLASRLILAQQEVEVLSNPDFSDYLIVNNDLATAVRQAEAIIHSERLRLKHARADIVSLLKDF